MATEPQVPVSKARARLWAALCVLCWAFVPVYASLALVNALHGQAFSAVLAVGQVLLSAWSAGYARARSARWAGKRR
jgi:hypothetical protein